MIGPLYERESLSEFINKIVIRVFNPIYVSRLIISGWAGKNFTLATHANNMHDVHFSSDSLNRLEESGRTFEKFLQRCLGNAIICPFKITYREVRIYQLLH